MTTHRIVISTVPNGDAAAADREAQALLKLALGACQAYLRAQRNAPQDVTVEREERPTLNAGDETWLERWRDGRETLAIDCTVAEPSILEPLPEGWPHGS
jgi:hypothetical protein